MRIVDLSLAFVLIGVGCSHRAASSTASTVSGTADLSSFPHAPTIVIAADDSGRVVRANIGTDGRFRLTLPKGHVYRIGFSDTSSETPLAFARGKGVLVGSFAVKGGGARVDLGAVRFRASAQEAATATSTVTTVAPVTCDDGSEGGGDGECENGKDSRTGGACAPDSVTMVKPADGTKPFALPDHEPPSRLDGCDDGADGDDVEHED